MSDWQRLSQAVAELRAALLEQVRRDWPLMLAVYLVVVFGCLMWIGLR